MSDQERSVERRSRSGCITCRSRRVKCDEQKPLCGQCETHGSECTWSSSDEPRKRFRVSAACKACRDRKVRCDGSGTGQACARCTRLNISCEFPQVPPNSRYRSGPSFTSPDAGSTHGTPRTERPMNGTPAPSIIASTPHRSSFSISETRTTPMTLEKLISDEVSMRYLVRKYFATVHQHSFLTFLHEPSLTYLVDLHRVPLTVVQLVLALTFLFDDYETKDSEQRVAQADEVFQLGYQSLQAQVFSGYGAMELMSVLLARAYEHARGRFASADVLWGMAVRMMHQLDLTRFDEKYPQAGPANRTDIINPLLKPESLRRLAWSCFYLDCTLDDNGPGLHTINSSDFRLPWPSDETCFLRDVAIKTMSEPYSDTGTDLRHNECPNHSHLGISAHLMQTAGMRRRVIHFDNSIPTSPAPPLELLEHLAGLENESKALVATLPPHLAYTEDNLYIHGPRRPMFQTLHLLRHSCFLLLAKARIHICARHPEYSVIEALKDRIRHASAVAGMALDTVQLGINADPFIARITYEAVESLVFDPPRLVSIAGHPPPMDGIYARALRQLLDLLRKLAVVDASSAYLRTETCVRLDRFGFRSLLTDDDRDALASSIRDSDPQAELQSFTPHRVPLDLQRTPIAPDKQSQPWSPLDVAAVLSPSQRTTSITQPSPSIPNWLNPSPSEVPLSNISQPAMIQPSVIPGMDLPTSPRLDHWDPHEPSTWRMEASEPPSGIDNSPDDLLAFMGLVQQASKGYAGLDSTESFNWFTN